MYNGLNHRGEVYYHNYPAIHYWYPYYPIYQQIPQNYERNYNNEWRSIQETQDVQRPIIIPEDTTSENRQNAPVILVNSWAEKNPNWRARCGCSQHGTCSTLNRGKSYAAVDYNHGVGPGKYKIKVWIKHFGKEYYGKPSTFAERWRKFKNAPASYTHFQTDILSGPNAPGRQGYFMNDNNDTVGPQTGTLGLEVYDKNTGEHVWGSLYYFDEGFGNWGNEWLRCGHDYGFQFKDA